MMEYRHLFIARYYHAVDNGTDELCSNSLIIIVKIFSS